MGNTKTAGMKYEVTGTKNIKDVKSVAVKMADSLSTPALVWILVKRHKVAILATGNIVLVLNWALPAWPAMLTSIFKV